MSAQHPVVGRGRTPWVWLVATAPALFFVALQVPLIGLAQILLSPVDDDVPRSAIDLAAFGTSILLPAAALIATATALFAFLDTRSLQRRGATPAPWVLGAVPVLYLIGRRHGSDRQHPRGSAPLLLCAAVLSSGILVLLVEVVVTVGAALQQPGPLP